MKTAIKNSILLPVLFLIPMSCNNLIDLEPVSVISVSSFWKTEEDAKAGLYGMYTQFRDFAAQELIWLGEARSEIMTDGIQNADFRIKYFKNTITQENADRNWKQLYRTVNFANLVIKYAPGIEFSNEASKKDVIAQAYTMRAYAYFVMTRTWGALPLLTEPAEGYDAETTFKQRMPQEEVFQLIKSDIDQAYSLFSGNLYPAGRCLWSKPALNLLKAEVYLWTSKRLNAGNQDATIALSALNEAESSDVTLLEDFSNVFSYSNKGNKEIILSVNFRNGQAGDNYFSDTYITANDLSANTNAATKKAIGTAGGNNWWAPSELVRSQFSMQDQRRKASFIEVYRANGQDSTYLSTVVVKGKGLETGGIRRFLDDIVIYRYADLILLKAEAKNILGQDPTEEINKIRKRAFGNDFEQHVFTNGNRDQNDEAILKERLLEFAFEGKRWWDLVRFGKAFEKVPSLKDRQNDQYLLLWPLSLQTLNLNSRLVQNPGYGF